ncbi:proline-rich receptor-like protein kinase PERK3 [Hevea brasiliensis]|uniref:proline-rich receptor-like protein kinase PERK3 n=1 Tax=Hevea brasiliensis TaxID=3981 RepID=UPI0025E89397|nr:proline-rich receptor-like protein kinase PERK3 [Hevea brasiliensis]
MSTEAQPQRVVVIQDASRDVNPSAIRWLLENFSLKTGDVLIIFGVLHQSDYTIETYCYFLSNANYFPFALSPNNPFFFFSLALVGYKVKVDSSSAFIQEVDKKKKEYSTNAEIMRISKHCEVEQIEFHIEVRPGPSPKVVALKAARTLKATWVVLDRKMKKDKKYFMEKLQCGISRMKRDNTVVVLRGPKARVNITHSEIRIQTKSQVRYDEMIPGSPRKRIPSQNQLAPPRISSGKEVYVDHSEEIPCGSYSQSTFFSKSSSSDQVMTAVASTSSLTEARHFHFNYHNDKCTKTERETGGEQSPFSNAESNPLQRGQKEVNTESPNELKQQRKYDDWMGGGPTDELFQNSICSICKNRRPRIGWNRDFIYAELHAATEGFSRENFLSEGGFGFVYRGELGGLQIAVKQHKSASFQGEKEFKSEVNVLSKARNENLVMLLGSCSEGSHRLLVYEYVCNGSLDQHLSSKNFRKHDAEHSRRTLSWEKRMKIALGAAKGLQYLHKNNIIHRDMRPNNILITHDHEALLGDFGLARTQHDNSDHSWETRVVGTLGYLAPEYAECGRVSKKTDVYSFGVVLLQLITGLKTTDKILGGKSLVGWARPLLKEKNYPDLMDPRILDSHDVHQLFWMVRVAEKCLSKDPHKRLTMDKVYLC